MSDPVFLPVAPWTPDMPSFRSGDGSKAGCQTALNVLPRTNESYGPANSITEFSSALTARCQGAYACLDASGNVYVFFGDATNLYDLTASSSTVNNISKVSGSYSIASDGMWDMALFGQRVIAADYADPLQSFILGTSTVFADLAYGGVLTLTVTGGSGYTNGTNYALSASGGGGSGFAGLVDVVGGALTNARITSPGQLYTSAPTISVTGAGSGTGGSVVATIADIAPKAKYGTVVDSFYMVANTVDPTNGSQTQRVWWCAINNPIGWPTPGTSSALAVQSDYTDLPGEGGEITGIIGGLGNVDVAVFMSQAIYRGVYAGTAAVFNFFPVQGVRGCVAPGSLVKVGSVAYFLSEDGFYTFDGNASSPIGVNIIDKTFYADVQQKYLSSVVGAVDPINKLIAWAYPGALSSAGIPDTILFYNYVTGWFTKVSVGCEWLVRALTFGYTLDQIYTVLGYTFQTMPFNFDSRVWTGGNSILGAVSTNHKLSFFNGTSLGATVDMPEIQPSPGMRTVVDNARPIIDGGTPSIAILHRNRLIDSKTVEAAVAINRDGLCPQSISDRYITPRLTTLAGDSFTHIQGAELDVSPDSEG